MVWSRFADHMPRQEKGPLAAITRQSEGIAFHMSASARSGDENVHETLAGGS